MQLNVADFGYKIAFSGYKLRNRQWLNLVEKGLEFNLFELLQHFDAVFNRAAVAHYFKQQQVIQLAAAKFINKLKIDLLEADLPNNCQQIHQIKGLAAPVLHAVKQFGSKGISRLLILVYLVYEGSDIGECFYLALIKLLPPYQSQIKAGLVIPQQLKLCCFLQLEWVEILFFLTKEIQ